ncbi:hypothetical protein [Xanthobacter tagetidis]|uniref:Cysteine rich repeat-containing protein n=1 Tax=Xanthobacter tagetidis TaxID=60216 RepID=A0A3L7AEF4_9HYPH|nr:hypothetical protein [Xanthobacter tagetidis]MBB6308447.1 pyruvate/2-oxoglutarate dehydrogenase complex dihydrolipoamide acyltransferase (E2) component [Xanthobacter tagetidis]RLP78769.1 hypothetical protein D9R14_10995 [Xanthobacter tagetidis]
MTIGRLITGSVRGGALAAALFAAGTAAAQTPTSAQQQALKASCQSDFRANCAGVSPGGQAALACLQKNVAQLSANCQSAVNAIGGAPAAATPATSAPAATTPAPATTAPATTAPATKPASKPTTPPPPKPPKPAAVPPPPPAAAPPTVIVLSPREEIVLVRRFCGADVRTFCQGVPLGRGNIATCLAANMPRLSPGCRGALTR